MRITKNRLILCMLGFVFSLSSCAIDNRLVIRNMQGHSNVFTIHGHQLVFPSPSEINFIPAYGARWVLSGDIAALVDSVVRSLELDSSVAITTAPGIQVRAQNITITYGDFMTDGSDSHLFLALEMEMSTTSHGASSHLCQFPTIKPELDQPVSHGLFTSNERIKNMILPAYEELISRALFEGFVRGFNCLSKEETETGRKGV